MRAIAGRRAALRVLANLVCFSAMLPFVSLVPIPGLPRTDVQLTATLIASAVLLAVFILAPETLTLTRGDLVILVCGVLSLLYVDWRATGMSTEWVRRTGQILLGFPVYYAVRCLYRFMSPLTLAAVVALYLAAMLLQLAAPSLYSSVAALVLSDVRAWIGTEFRGLTGLTQEPSQMGTLALFFLLAPAMFKRSYWLRHRWMLAGVACTCVLMLVMTLSATALMLTGVLSAVWLIFVSRRSLLWKGAVVAGCLVSVVAVRQTVLKLAETYETSRPLTFMAGALDRPFSAFQDASLGMRQAGLYAGLINLGRIPFGTASIVTDDGLIADALDSQAITWLVKPEDAPIVRAYALGTYRHPVLGSALGGISVLGQSIQRMGVFYVAIVAVLIAMIRGIREAPLFQVMFLAFVANGPIVMSLIWFTIGCFAANRGPAAGRPAMASRSGGVPTIGRDSDASPQSR